MTRGLFAYYYNRLDDCLPFRSLLDTEGGLRRMDRAEKATYQRMVAFGRIIRGPVPGYEHRAIEFQTMTLSLWVRDERTDPGDLLLEDLQDQIMRALVWRSPSSPIPGQDCRGDDPGIVVMDVEHIDGDSEPVFDKDMQAWTKSLSLRALVSLATCQPVLEGCSPCIHGENDEDAPGTTMTGTAFIFVDNGDEEFVDPYDLYVAHAQINMTLLRANVPVNSVILFYCICSLMPQFASAYFQGQRDATTEADYFHDSAAHDESTRIEYDANNWYVRPSQDLGERIATYILNATSGAFDGAYCDQSSGDIPNDYWEAWKNVHPSDNGGVALTDADRPYWENQWDLMHAAFLSTLKAGFGSSRAVVANSAGAVYGGIDGMAIEDVHILANGEAFALASFDDQRLEWEASPTRFGTRVLNVAWNYTLNAPGVFRGVAV